MNFIAFGQTGSGKTYTMLGPPGLFKKMKSGEIGDIPELFGIFPRTALNILKQIEQYRSQTGQPCFLTINIA